MVTDPLTGSCDPKYHVQPFSHQHCNSEEHLVTKQPFEVMRVKTSGVPKT